MLSLGEQLMLLALHEEKGTVRWAAAARLPYCLAGSLLMELILRQRLRIEPKLLEVLDRTPAGEPLLDDVLTMIDSARKAKAPYYWVSRIGRRIKPKKIKLLQNLVNRGILNCEERRILWIFPATRYPSRDDRPRNEIIANLRTIILRREHPDLGMMMLLVLLYTSALTDTILDKEERKEAHRYIRETVKPLPVTQAIMKAIRGAQAAMM